MEDIFGTQIGGFDWSVWFPNTTTAESSRFSLIFSILSTRDYRSGAELSCVQQNNIAYFQEKLDHYLAPTSFVAVADSKLDRLIDEIITDSSYPERYTFVSGNGFNSFFKLPSSISESNGFVDMKHLAYGYAFGLFVKPFEFFFEKYQELQGSRYCSAFLVEDIVSNRIGAAVKFVHVSEQQIHGSIQTGHGDLAEQKVQEHGQLESEATARSILTAEGYVLPP